MRRLRGPREQGLPMQRMQKRQEGVWIAVREFNVFK